MRDRREEILARLEAIADGLGYVTAERNLDEISDIKRPALIVHDADEEANETGVIVTMVPEVRILLGARPADVGSDLNEKRVQFVNAVLTDEAFKPRGAGSIIGPNGHARYRGTETALGHGRTMEGDMIVRIAFSYPLILSELS